MSGRTRRRGGETPQGTVNRVVGPPFGTVLGRLVSSERRGVGVHDEGVSGP